MRLPGDWLRAFRVFQTWPNKDSKIYDEILPTPLPSLACGSDSQISQNDVLATIVTDQTSCARRSTAFTPLEPRENVRGRRHPGVNEQTDNSQADSKSSFRS